MGINKRTIRITDREWSGNLWSRIRALITGLNDRIEAQEEAGYITEETDPTVPAWAKAATKPTYTAAEIGAIATSEKGSANGVAELDSGGKVPSSQLPSYVDDVLEYANSSGFPVTGETGKIYVAKNNNITYRWTGSGYVEISPSIALGETSSTAYRGDRGKIAYDHAQAHGSAFASGLYKITTNAEGHVTAASGVAKKDITALGIPDSDTNTTYTLTQDSSDGHKITLTGSDGKSKTVTIPDNDTKYTFSDGDPTLTWGQRSTVGTTGGVALHVTMPARPTYTAQDVGALPSSTFIPGKTSDLTNDGDGASPFATEAYVNINGGKIDEISVNGAALAIVDKTVDIDVPVAMSNAEIDAIMDAPLTGTLSMLRFTANAGENQVDIVEALTTWTTSALTWAATATEVI